MGLFLESAKNEQLYLREHGRPGDNGKSAYEIWLEQGNEGTEEDFLESLKGDDYVLTEADKEDIAERAAEKVQKPDIPQGMASEDWVNANFQPKGEYVTDEELEEKLKDVSPEGYATEEWTNENFQPKGNYLEKVPAEYITEAELAAKGYQTKTEADGAYQPKGSYATTEQLAQTEAKIPTKVSQLGNDKNYLEAETDPTVPSWAKAASKPTYTKSEVGLGNVANERQYSANNPPPYPVTSVNGSTGAVEVEPKGTAQTKVTNHNADDEAHNDIRLLISALTKKVNDLLDSDDTTLDQMSEVVAYIKANRELLESYTTEKVNVADIIDNLTTSVSNKPLSAKQGVQLKALIDAITVPTALSQLSGDSTHRTVTDAEKTAWNAKSTFSGNYNDLTNKPTIPTVPTKVSAFENDAKYVTETDFAKLKNYVTPQMFGAVADGSTDDTKAIQDAFDSLTEGGTIYFPKGKYIVQHSATVNGGDYVAVLVEGKQGITVVFENGTTIKHNLTDKGRYTMFRFIDCDGVEIRGGVIEGERNEHPDVVTGYGSKGLHIRNCDNVYIHDMEIWNIFGDSIGLSGTTKQCGNILVENCTIHDCYRNGIGVGGVKNGIIRNCRIYNISGNAPEAGIDIEAEYGYNNEDILIESCHIHDCTQNTIAFSSNSYNLKVRDCLLDGGTQGQTTSDNIELLNTTVTGTVNARNNTVLRNCIVKGIGLYDSADYPNVNVKAYNTIFNGNDVSTTFNINNINGKATLYFKDCELNRLENSSYALFYAYNASNTEITIEGGSINLWNSTLDMPFASGDYALLKIIGCRIVAKSSTMAKSLLSANASEISLIDCNIDMSEVATYSSSDIATFDATVNTLNCHGNTFVTKAVVQWVFNLSGFKGNAYLTHNTAPTINSFYLPNTSGGTVFARANTIKDSVDFTTADKEKLDNLEQGPEGKSAYEIYVDNGGTLSETEWLGSIASVAPTYAATTDEMTDPAKVYIGNEGTLWAQIKQETVINENVFDPNAATLNAYLNEDGSLNTTAAAAKYYSTTDFLPFNGSTASSYNVKIKAPLGYLSQNQSGVVYYDENKNKLLRYNLRKDYTSSSTYFVDNADGTSDVVLNKRLNGSAVSSSVIAATRYVKFSFYTNLTNATLSDLQDVTICFEENEETVYQYQWADTGIQYAHYAMTDNDYEVIVNKVVEKLNA